MENEIESLFDIHSLRAFKESEGKHIETEEGVKIPRKSDMSRLVELAKLSGRNKTSEVASSSSEEAVKEEIKPKKELGSVLAGLSALAKSKEIKPKSKEENIEETVEEKPISSKSTKSSKTTTKKSTTTKKTTAKKSTSKTKKTTTKKTATKKSTTKTTKTKKEPVVEVVDNEKVNNTSYKELTDLKLKLYEEMMEMKDEEVADVDTTNNTPETLVAENVEVENNTPEQIEEIKEDKLELNEEDLNKFIDKVVEDINNNKFIKEMSEKLLESSEEDEKEVEKEVVEESKEEVKPQEENIESSSQQIDAEVNEEIEEVKDEENVVEAKEDLSENIDKIEENEEMENKLKTKETELFEMEEYIQPVIEEAKEAQLLVEELDDNEIVIDSKSYNFFYFSQDDMEQREQEAEERKESVVIEKELGDINLNSTIANAGNIIVEDEDKNVDVIATVNGVEMVQKTEEEKNLSVLYVASECQPFIATGGLADVAGSLPKAVAQEGGVDIRVILPLYKATKEKWLDKFEYMGNFTVHLSWRKEYCGIFRYFDEGVVYYFVDNDRYFGSRDQIYGYYDDGERYAFFSKAVVECLPFINYFPNIIHCNDWQSSLVSTYIKTGNWSDDRYYNIKNIYTIHNVEYQGVYGMENLKDLFGIDERYIRDMEYNGDINLTKAAIQFCDKFTTVSESYCDNLKQPYCSRGLHYIIIRNEYKLSGIINGIDYDFYNPMTDKIIYKNYDLEHMNDKVENKKAFQAELGLPVDRETPLFSIVSRLVSHKGLDLVTRIMEDALQKDIQLVIVGTGDARFVDYFKYLENKYPTKVRALTDKYSNELARKAYAASDIFIMPSKIEPCGISQMIASRYGTVPIVREVGGLKDSITDFGCENGGNGYTFTHYNAQDLLYLINRAAEDFKDKEGWKKKMETCMKVDFTWSTSAKKYIDLYKSLV